ncbi:MAG: hypothetical protein A2836_02840 [Candidatus Taylorbacteria bacterium RIFCSPHIGHO2_01_FULL_45_63]|uniref:Uncharacterized protein n=1 Tax=Candidatus Taylorbacteria bacterium RIFCSPHIGHO2_02_FULL_45_35 TaxID=1802311 RepID=A0A1G2MRZ3_9BACT|nr:MAG: hypothetical protein A2836_02840 [Candidatus Taylorbacteria bacterium RIFCSPHIGHO2_01_FULL_45_63]OHA26633.1 MAG: hypothetical protein A3D56_02255 [Candidatus Taylorbacteria bacterium RIFCSPHIGHO2_02_FULL_45_35]OHA33564.1 MAG: hypothetical protein A3A22_03560 [Candidatus Taylorbacteria bacterium RIFCSPLOWO2_01_FULL_45_34b]
MFQKMLLKHMLAPALKNVPEEQKQKILAIVDKDPDFLMRIAKEAEVKIKGGMDQMTALKEVFKANEEALRKLTSSLLDNN